MGTVTFILYNFVFKIHCQNPVKQEIKIIIDLKKKTSPHKTTV